MKKQTVEEFLAQGGHVRYCRPTRRQAKSLRRMRRDEELKSLEQNEKKPPIGD